MYSRIVGMSSIRDDKSALKECYKNEGGRGHDERDDRINLSAPVVALESHLGACDSHMYSKTSSSDKPTNKKYSKKIPPRRLAFCGGGIRCVGHIGVFKALDESNLLKCVKEIIGISGGTLFGLMYVLGYTVKQLEYLAVRFDFTRIASFDIDDILLFPSALGLNKADSLDNCISLILQQKGFEKEITFLELSKKTRVALRCYATDIETLEVKEMSVLKTPHMSVKMAVKASMALPILYTPTKDGESLLVDGGLVHNLPLTYMNSSDISETWGVLFYNDSSEHTKVESIFDYFSKLFDGLVSYKNSIIVEKYRERLILVDPANFSGLNFSESKETRSEFIDICRKKTLEFIGQSTKPSRRYSVS